MPNKFYKIRCQTLSEIAYKINQIFGPSAIVVATQEVKENGIWGLLGRKVYEVTVSVPEEESFRKQNKSLPEKKYLANASTSSELQDEEKEKKLQEYEKIIRETQQRLRLPTQEDPEKPSLRKIAGNKENASQILPFPQEQEPKNSTSKDELARTLREIKELLQLMSIESAPGAIPQEVLPVYRELINLGMSKKLTAELIHIVIKTMDPSLVKDTRILRERLAIELRKRITTTGGISILSGTTRWVVFCGPTGVGKTTTLAKISAYYAVHKKVKVALATTDTYRIAATEQLKIYSQIIGIPLKIIEDKNSAWESLNELSTYDIVLMDTAGNSPFNTNQIKELKEILSIIKPYETILVLSAHTPLEDLRYAVAGFSSLNPTSLCFSKLDETRRYGAMISLILELGLPVSYITYGQNVPDDFSVATSSGIVQLLIEGKLRRG
ncbi:MAG: flagellar biosynthesis protein FlhF [Candidatus Hydrogenedentes bacterium]|nr:flagellar biosynthesis protein FlhF [Candidatus Hydrogenedentota bacterium]